MKELFRKKSVTDILAQARLNEHSASEHDGRPALTRNLNVRDLTALGIAAIIGAGIFGTIGEASYNGGPAVIFLFIFIAIACGFSALCYAEFSSAIPLSGSAYTYAYVAFGEIIAWIIGWDLIIEYAIGNIVVAISWSDYFSELMKGIGWSIPECFTMDYLTAVRKYPEALAQVSAGTPVEQLPRQLRESYLAYQSAPSIGGIKIIADFPALVIVTLITALVYIGIKESKRASNAMVLLKIGVILLVITLGAFYVQPENWTPFAPNGFSGVMKGVAAVFFAFIGFDALSTTSEECVNPRKDLPRAIIFSLLICTVLYVAIALVLTGLVPYTDLKVGDPLAYAFKQADMPALLSDWVSGIIAVSAIIAMASVLLVFQMGQPRIWMAMSRDGLLPEIFSRIHAKFHTPWFATIITGIVVAIPCLFMNLSEVTELSSIGTLFAFVLVCAGVLKLHYRPSESYSPGFKVPYINGKWVVMPALMLLSIWITVKAPEVWTELLPNAEEAFYEKVPIWVFAVSALTLGVLSFWKNLSLIPVLGLMSCLYLMSKVPHESWWRFLIWLSIGLVVYYLYGRRKSKLAEANNTD